MNPEHLTWTDPEGKVWDLTHGWEDTEGVVWTLYGWEIPILRDRPRRPVVHCQGVESLDTYTLDTLDAGFGPLKAVPDVRPEWWDKQQVPKSTGGNAPVWAC